MAVPLDVDPSYYRTPSMENRAVPLDVGPWYKALKDEDCVSIMRLLKEDPSLVKKGWKKGDAQEGTGEAWMGRSVFHVAARRGCVELIVRALKACTFEEMVPQEEKEACEQLFDRALKRYDFEANFHAVQELLDVPTSSSNRNEEVAVASAGQSSMSRNPRLDEHGTGTIPSTKSGGDNIAPLDQSDQAHSERDDENDKNSGSSQHASDCEQQTMPENLQTSSGDRGRTFKRIQKSLKKATSWGRKDTETEHSRQKSAVPPPSPERSGPVLSDNDNGGNTDEPAGESRKDLFRILCSKDGLYKGDALALAVLSYNPGVIDLLTYAIKTCEPRISWIEKRTPEELLLVEEADEEKRSWLRDGTKQIIVKWNNGEGDFGGILCCGVGVSECLRAYLEHLDFNFLPYLEYLVHFCFVAPVLQNTLGMNTVSKCIKSLPSELQPFVAALRDGQGRALIHVAAETGDISKGILTLGADIKVQFRKPNININYVVEHDGGGKFDGLIARDGNGKFAFDRYSFGRHRSPITDGVVFGGEGKFVPQYMGITYTKEDEYDSSHKMDVNVLSKLNGFRAGKYTSDIISAAIIHNQLGLLESMDMKPRTPKETRPWWKKLFHQFLFPICHKRQNETRGTEYLGDYSYPLGPEDFSPPDEKLVSHGYDYEDHEGIRRIQTISLTHLQLAGIMANDPDIVCHLLSKGYRDRDKRNFIPGMSSMHTYAALGDYKSLKRVIDSPYCDPFIEDEDENNPLHSALREPFRGQFKRHLLDYASCEHLLHNDDREKVIKVKELLNEDTVAERKGCVNLLLQAGCDAFKVNKQGQGPYPQGCFGSNGKFLSWWYEVQTKEFAATQTSLTTAANAISITATLVATASYNGPLQPPMGYDAANHIQYENGWVAAFVYCDTLSFYLAIAAIIFSLIPSLPVPQQAMQDELRRTRRMVVLAVGVLFPSIICVLLAFGSSSMAVVSAKIITSSVGGKLTIASMLSGAPIILVAFFLFFTRLLGICFPRNSYIRKMYKWTSL